MISSRLKPFGTSIFSEMTRLATERGAINLAQGFPDFNGPAWMMEAAFEAMRSGRNQYSRSQGLAELTTAIAGATEALYSLRYDPLTEIGVFAGATEAICASLLGLLDAGDEVILIEPFYDSYPACVALGGATPRFHTLRAPAFELDLPRLAELFNDKTRLLVLNSPHNPTGKVFTTAELEGIAALCRKHDVLVLSDEVYEHLTYDGAKHVPIASLPGMRERTVTLGSAGKTFSFTGWKIGWAIGPAKLLAAAQAAHQFITFCAATPFQLAVAHALTRVVSPGDTFLAELKSDYLARRNFLAGALSDAGFEVHPSAGTYFITAGFSALSSADDRTFAKELVEKIGVASIPPSAFYTAEPEEGRKLLRFAFCKKPETLEVAAARLRKLRS